MNSLYGVLFIQYPVTTSFLTALANSTNASAYFSLVEVYKDVHIRPGADKH